MSRAGTPKRLTMNGAPDEGYCEGDLLRSVRGVGFMVDRARPSPSKPGRWILECTRIGTGVLGPDDLDVVHFVPGP